MQCALQTVFFDVLACDSLQCKDYCYTNPMKTIGNHATGGNLSKRKNRTFTILMVILSLRAIGKTD